MQETEDPNTHKKRVSVVVDMLKKKGRYDNLVEVIKKEMENIRTTATLTEKYIKTCEILESHLTAEDRVEIENILKD